MKTIITAGIMSMVFAVIVSCNTQKQIAKRDNAAVERITAKRSLLAELKPFVDSIWPCIVDTTGVMLLPGKVDTLRISSGGDVYSDYGLAFPFLLDTTWLFKYKDSTKLTVDSSISKHIDEAYKSGYVKGFQTAVEQFNSHQLFRAPDTMTYSLRSRRELNIANDALHSTQQQLSGSRSLAESYKQDRNYAYLYLIIAIILLVGTNLLWAKLKFKI